MQVGECPLWHPIEAVLYWIDIPACAVHRLDPQTGIHRIYPVPAEPGCIAHCATGGLMVALRSGIARLDTSDGTVTMEVPAPYNTAVMRFNDGRCDAAGRFWMGTMYEPRDRPLGALFCLDRGALRNAGNPVTVSNGVAFSGDGTTLYHADTTAHVIRAHEFDQDTGHIDAGRVLHQFSTDRAATDYGGRPDGATVDAEGAYWCAMFEGGRLLRLAPSGAVLEEVLLPMHCPTMMAFGGPDLRTLYVTSASQNRPAAELAQYPLSGCVVSLRVNVPGRVEPAYIE
jgi:sugar lactone lactonase YvrE